MKGMVGAPTDQERIRTLLPLLCEGFHDRIMLSHDTVNVWLGRPPQMPEPLASLMSNWHVGHLFEAIIPTLKKEGVTEEQLEQMLVQNPANWVA